MPQRAKEEFDWQTVTFENSKNIAQVIAIQKTTSLTLQTLAQDMTKIDEIILSNGQIKRDVGEIKKEMQTNHARVQEDRKKLKPVFWVMENKRVFFALLVSSYMLTFYEVRTAIGIHLEPIAKMILAIKNVLAW